MLRSQTWDDSTCIRCTDGAADRVDGTYVSPLAGNAPPGPVTQSPLRRRRRRAPAGPATAHAQAQAAARSPARAALLGGVLRRRLACLRRGAAGGSSVARSSIAACARLPLYPFRAPAPRPLDPLCIHRQAMAADGEEKAAAEALDSSEAPDTSKLPAPCFFPADLLALAPSFPRHGARAVLVY